MRTRAQRRQLRISYRTPCWFGSSTASGWPQKAMQAMTQQRRPSAALRWQRRLLRWQPMEEETLC